MYVRSYTVNDKSQAREKFRSFCGFSMKRESFLYEQWLSAALSKQMKFPYI